ncbi:protein DpdD [Pseudomonas sp. NPDC078416]|uniref:protein DpdD n=1 Tax=Pseudomonas sp. NPDC078416 TaxID=3390637 RepID=UPI003CFE738A
MNTIPTWLQPFFAADNQIDPDKVFAGKYPQPYQSLLEPLLTSACAEQWPLLLPYSRPPELCFYAAAEDSRALEELRQVLAAFLGTADTCFDYGLIITPSNEGQSALLAHAPTGLLRIDLLDEVDDQQKYRVFTVLANVLQLYRQRPALTSLAKRPIGRVLRDFMLAYRLRDGEGAWQFYGELKNSGSFTPPNLLSLELQALASADRWQDIVSHPRLPSLLGGRIPLRLVRVLLRALGQLGLNRLLISEAIGKERRGELADLCRPLSPLFMTVPLFESHESFKQDWQLWIAGTVTLRCAQTQQVPEFIDSDWFRKLLHWADLVELDQSEAAIKPIVGEAKDLTEGPVAVQALLQSSLDVPLVELHQLWQKLQAMPASWFEPLKSLPMMTAILQNLQKRYSTEHLGGWDSWFQRLVDTELPTGALEREAQEYCEDWAVDSFSSDGFLKCINTASPVGQTTLRNTLPLLLDWLEERNVACPGVVWLELLELLALDSIVNPALLSLAAQLTQLMLEQPFAVDGYTRLVDSILMLWEINKGPEAYTGMLELLDLLLDAPCPAEPLRRQVWQSLQDFATKHWRQIKEPAVRELTFVLMQEILEVGEPAPAFGNNKESGSDIDSVTEPTADLQGKLLGIYTLTEGAARRARDVLEVIFAGLKVEINCDHTATPALCNLAKTADYFVFSSRSSKHQAFYPVINIRRDIIYPHGKGASSIIREFIEGLKRKTI